MYDLLHKSKYKIQFHSCILPKRYIYIDEVQFCNMCNMYIMSNMCNMSNIYHDCSICNICNICHICHKCNMLAILVVTIDALADDIIMLSRHAQCFLNMICILCRVASFQYSQNIRQCMISLLNFFVTISIANILHVLHILRTLQLLQS